jgi:hypothetical protein
MYSKSSEKVFLEHGIYGVREDETRYVGSVLVGKDLEGQLRNYHPRRNACCTYIWISEWSLWWQYRQWNSRVRDWR